MLGDSSLDDGDGGDDSFAGGQFDGVFMRLYHFHERIRSRGQRSTVWDVASRA